jgi:peptidyl-prolyl cis-trans isomerase B (cyclophilin B)
VTTNRDRRAAARARLEREMAARAVAARRRRRIQALVGGGVAALLVAGAVVWIALATGDDKATPSAAASAAPSGSPSPAGCVWRPLADPSASPAPQPLPSGAREVGTPPAGEPHAGRQTMTITTNQGVIKVDLDLAKVPCTAASFTHLASKRFFDNTRCHRLVPSIGALQCGDPAGDGTGGPTYRFADENLPVGQRPAYTRGLVAMANSGPDTNGSQFFFVYEDNSLQPQYTVIGRVTEGLEVIDKIAQGGHDGAYEPQPGGGKPKTEVVITSLTMSAPAA